MRKHLKHAAIVVGLGLGIAFAVLGCLFGGAVHQNWQMQIALDELRECETDSDCDEAWRYLNAVAGKGGQ